MKIPDTYIDELLNRLDIVELIDRYVPLKKAGANYAACCPFHSEKTPSFTVSPSKQFYHCFGCGAHGTAIGFLMQYAGQGFIEAVEDLSAQVGMRIPEQTSNTFQSPSSHARRSSLSELMAQAAHYYYQQLKDSPRAIEYLKKRGLSGEVVRTYMIGYAPDGWQNLEAVFSNYSMPELQESGLVIRNEQGQLYDRFRDRIMFPIINPKGETIAFGGRILDQGEPKYLNSPETPLFEKGREVFGLPQARQALREKNAVVVVEGYMDVVALAQHGVNNAVATLGTATTPTHVQKLLRQVDRLIYCFDGDQAGRKAAWRALENSLENAHEQKFIGFVFLPERDDPDSFVREQGAPAFERLLAHAMPLSDFMLRELATQCDMNSAEGRAKLVADAKPRLLRLQTPLLRLQLVKRIAEMSGFSQQEVERLCELRSFNRAAPAKVARQAPSLLRHLLRLLIQKPELCAQVPVNLLPDTQEGQSIRRLQLHMLDFEHPPTSFAVLLERLNADEGIPLLSEVLAESLQQPLDAAVIDDEFAAVLVRLKEGDQRRSFQQLQEKAQKLGITGLSSEEKQEYLRQLTAHATQANSL